MTNLRLLRKKLGIKQKDLAEAVGVKPPLLCQVENGDRLPWPKLLRAAAEAMGVPFSILEPDLKRRKSEGEQFEQPARDQKGGKPLETRISIVLDTQEENSLGAISDMIASGLNHFDISKIVVTRGTDIVMATYIKREDNVIPIIKKVE